MLLQRRLLLSMSKIQYCGEKVPEKRLSPRNCYQDGARGWHWRNERLSRHCKAVNEEQRCPGQALHTRQEQQLLASLGLIRAAPGEAGDGSSH